MHRLQQKPLRLEHRRDAVVAGALIVPAQLFTTMFLAASFDGAKLVLMALRRPPSAGDGR